MRVVRFEAKQNSRYLINVNKCIFSPNSLVPVGVCFHSPIRLWFPLMCFCQRRHRQSVDSEGRISRSFAECYLTGHRRPVHLKVRHGSRRRCCPARHCLIMWQNKIVMSSDGSWDRLTFTGDAWQEGQKQTEFYLFPLAQGFVCHFSWKCFATGLYMAKQKAESKIVIPSGFGFRIKFL